MSSLWTPGGEHRVPRRDTEGPSAAPAAPARAAPEGATPGEGAERAGETRAAEAAEADERLAALENELLAAPASDVVANHCYGLFELAAVHLDQRPPRLVDAQVAIDALGAIVERLGDRLGPSAPTLHDALARIRLAYVQIASAATADGGAAS